MIGRYRPVPIIPPSIVNGWSKPIPLMMPCWGTSGRYKPVPDVASNRFGMWGGEVLSEELVSYDEIPDPTGTTDLYGPALIRATALVLCRAIDGAGAAPTD